MLINHKWKKNRLFRSMNKMSTIKLLNHYRYCYQSINLRLICRQVLYWNVTIVLSSMLYSSRARIHQRNALLNDPEVEMIVLHRIWPRNWGEKFSLTAILETEFRLGEWLRWQSKIIQPFLQFPMRSEGFVWLFKVGLYRWTRYYSVFRPLRSSR